MKYSNNRVIFKVKCDAGLNYEYAGSIMKHAWHYSCEAISGATCRDARLYACEDHKWLNLQVSKAICLCLGLPEKRRSQSMLGGRLAMKY